MAVAHAGFLVRRGLRAGTRRGSVAQAIALLLAITAGCRHADSPAQFPLNLEGRDPATVSPAQRLAIVEALEELFGTPDEPRVPPGVGLRADLVVRAAGPANPASSRPTRGLFRTHCAACHGISGDGAGPRARHLDPYPRDYRPGLFKYTSTAGGAKPVAADLRRTLVHGLPGTAMPSFGALPAEDIEALVHYVRFLSIRGETELCLLRLVVDEDAYLPLDMELVMEEGVLPAAHSWELPEQQPEAYVVRPPARPPIGTPQQWLASVAKGQTAYASASAQCVKCHGPEGRGDGEEKELYDDWNKPKKGVTPEQTAQLARLFSLPIQQLRPRSFEEGVFHGGNRPEDLYLRIHVGIKGTPMAGVGPAPGTKGVLPPEDIWHVVHYVLWLAHQGPQFDHAG